MTTTATVTVTGRSWDEDRLTEVDPTHAVARAVFSTSYEGDIVGSSTAALLISYVGGDTSDPHSLVGPYVGYEQVTGTLDGREGTFVLATRASTPVVSRAPRSRWSPARAPAASPGCAAPAAMPPTR